MPETEKIRFYKLAFEAVYNISKILLEDEKKYNPFQKVIDILVDHMKLRRGMILIYDESSDLLFVKGAVGIDQETLKKIHYKPGEGIVGRVFKLGISMMIPDISQEPMFLNKIHRDFNFEDTAFYAVIIKDNENKKYGVLAVDKDLSETINIKTEFDLMSIISNMLGNYLKRTKLLQQEIESLKQSHDRLMTQVIDKYNYKSLVGKSKVMKTVFEQISIVTKSKAPVLLIGESGTGKEVVAKTIHYNSDRAKGPFIAINCAAIPAELIESEIFGYEKGAFTGAVAQKKGKFELANGGTLFLDEIGDMPLGLQSKLLRIIQEKEFERVGGTSTIKADVRIIAATNKNLSEEVQKGNFRLDLYYRLNVFTIYLPPLRQRKEDIPELANFIVTKLNKEYKLNKKLSTTFINELFKCNFPGNIRELENCIERAYFNSKTNIITENALKCNSCRVIISQIEVDNQYPSHTTEREHQETESQQEIREHKRVLTSEKDLILEALEKCGWVQAKAARYLGMTIRQLNYRISKLNIEIKKI
ncbi:MAG: nif-specific transcriptional activator NifA [Calditerrivibrio sp.]|nr:nif-specific transcriptional activator NifA [Calditerrivibrio sp.]